MASSDLDAGPGSAPNLDEAPFQVFRSTIHKSCDRFVIAPLSRQCLPVQFLKDQWRTRPAPQILRFELEAVLPIDAEDMDLFCQPHQQGWFTIAVDRTKYEQEIDDRRNDGGSFAGVCPIVLLAVNQLKDVVDSVRPVLVVWRTGQEFDILAFENGNLIAWQWVTDNDPAVYELAKSLLHEHKFAKAVFINCGASFDLESLKASLVASEELPSTLDFECREMSVVDAAQLTVEQYFEGSILPRYLFDCQSQTFLDRVSPYSGVLLTFGMALPAMLIIVATCMQFWRMEQQSIIDDSTHVQEKLFQDLFQNQRIPVGIRTRFESEVRQLEATRGVAEKSHQIGTVLPTLHAFLSATPADNSVRFRWDRLEFISGKLMLGIGVTNSFKEYEVIASSLKQAGFAIPPLSLSQSNEGVSMRIENAPHTPYVPVQTLPVQTSPATGTATTESTSTSSPPVIDTKIEADLELE